MFGKKDKKKNKEKREEVIQKYTEYKNEFMSDEEIEEGYNVIENVRRSYRDKENKCLYDLWEEIDDYWEGNANEPTDDADPASSTNIVHPNIEGQVALLVEKNITAYVEPVSLAEVQYVKPANIISQWIIEKNKMRKKLDMTWRDLKKKGLSIAKVSWDEDYMQGFGKPEISFVDPKHFYIDPNVTRYDKAQEAEFQAEAIPSSIHMARMEFGEDKADAIISDYEPFEDAYGFENLNNETQNKYIKILYWNKEKNEIDDTIVRLRVYSGCGVLLYDSNSEKHKAKEVTIEVTIDENGNEVEIEEEKEKDVTLGYYPSCSKYNYHFTPCYARDSMFWCKTEGELLLHTQDLINDIDDQIRINARLTGNPQKLIDTSSGIDPDKVTNEAGLNIPTNDINAVKYLQPPNVPAYIIQRRNQALTYERPLLTRFNDQMVGQRVSGVDTATESLQLTQSGMSGIDHSKALFEETMGDVMSQCFDLVSYYWTDIQAFKITDQDDFTMFRGSDLGEIQSIIPASMETMQKNKNLKTEVLKDENGEPLKKKAEFDFYVRIGAGMPKNQAFLYNVMKESFIGQAIDVYEYRKYLQQTLNLPIEEKNTRIESMQIQSQMQADGLKKQQRQQMLEAPVGSGNPNTQGLNANGQIDRRAVSTGTGPAILQGGN